MRTTAQWVVVLIDDEDAPHSAQLNVRSISQNRGDGTQCRQSVALDCAPDNQTGVDTTRRRSQKINLERINHWQINLERINPRTIKSQPNKCWLIKSQSKKFQSNKFPVE